jgi:hypothetical protein
MMKIGAMEIEIAAEVLVTEMETEVLVTETAIVVLSERCIRLYALSAEMNALFLLSQFRTSLFIAGIVL